MNKNAIESFKKPDFKTTDITVFNDGDLKKIERQVSVMREILEDMNKVYWAKHGALSSHAYKDSAEQHADMVALGGLAKVIQDLKRNTGNLYCLSINIAAAAEEQKRGEKPEPA